MSFSLLHLVHVVLMSTPTKVMRITTSTIVAGVTRVSGVSLFSGMEFKYDNISRAPNSLDGNIRSAIFRIECSCPFPTHTAIASVHVDAFEYVSGYVLHDYT